MVSGTGLGRAAFHCNPVIKVVPAASFFLKVGGNGGRGRYKKRRDFSVLNKFHHLIQMKNPAKFNSQKAKMSPKLELKLGLMILPETWPPEVTKRFRKRLGRPTTR